MNFINLNDSGCRDLGSPPLLSDEWLDMDFDQFLEWVHSRLCVSSRKPNYNRPDTGDWAQCLYRYYDREGALLYIGITSEFATRDKAHFTAWPAWRQEAVFALVEWYPSRRVVEMAEAQAIKDEKPPGNRKWPTAYWSQFRSVPDAWWLKGRVGYRGDNPTWAIVSNGGPYWSPGIIPCPFGKGENGQFVPLNGAPEIAA